VERAIDTDILSALLRQVVAAEERIVVLTGTKVQEVTRNNGRFSVTATTPEGHWRQGFDQVVNALWEGQRAIDLSCGMVPKDGWVYRLKYRTIVRLPPELLTAPSFTMVLGRYGDVVVRPDGTAYLSWYPVGLQGWSNELEPPESWLSDCSANALDKGGADIGARIISAISEWIPAMARSHPLIVDAGIICAYGSTDVDDAGSALHCRSEVGITSDSGYYSIDPGKLTTAPLFGQQAADLILSE
jgi:hypothetical protein